MRSKRLGISIGLIIMLCSACASDSGIAEQGSALTVAGYKRAPCAAGINQNISPDSACVDMYIVGHQDDDLLFINPDIQTSIQNGNSVMVVYLSASQNLQTDDPYFELQWTQRERGILSAYQHMTGTSDPWQTSTPMYIPAGQQTGPKVARYERPLSAQYPNRKVTLVFLRLADGGLEGLWNGELQSSFNCSPGCPLPLESQSYTRQLLIDTLVWLMSTSYVDSVSTLDLTNLNYAYRGNPGDPYTDMGTHIMAGMFAVAALSKYQASQTTTKHLRVYRGYSATQEPSNLSNAERNAKFDAFNYYRHWDCTMENAAGQEVPCGAEKPACGAIDQCGDPNNCVVSGQPVPPNCGPCDPLDPSCTLGTPELCPIGDGASCPVFKEHWQRTFATRSLVGTTDLQGRLGVGSGCIATTGFVPLPRVNAVASSSYPGWPASYVMDGNYGTRWSSAEGSDPQSIYLDLGSPRYIKRVTLSWEAAYATSYRIDVSNDAINWVTKWSTTSGTGGTVEITLPPNSVGRYVRMYGTARGTPWGYSLWEFTADTFAALNASSTCTAAPSWTVTRTHQIQLSSTSSCLRSQEVGSAIELAPCSLQTESNTFFLMSSGQILSNPNTTTSQVSQFRAGSECVTANADGSLAHSYCDKRCINETTGVLEDCELRYQSCAGGCASGFSCQPTASGDRCLRSCCLELNPGEMCPPDPCIAGRETCRQYGDAAFACVPLPTGLPIAGQDWTLLFDTPTLRSTQFSDATEVDSASAYYRTFGIANGNVCVRRAGGVYCSAYGSQTAQLLSSGFSDSNGWLNDSSGSTVGVVWDSTVIPQGQLLTCGRGYYGATCTTGSTPAFSTAAGWASDAFYYNSIRYADVSGDGKPDICGRGYYGISCVLNLGTSFSASSDWSSSFTGPSGWNALGVGDTIQFGDINGDGKPDVCGRGDFGMGCETGTGSSFSKYHVWSADSDRRIGSANLDFSNSDVTPWKSSAAYYASIKLIDVNHDGLVDVCGRGSNGIYCGFSVGTGFARKRLVLSEEFRDGLGWNLPNKGATISFGNLDGDARVDICGRGFSGIICGEGY